MCNVCIITAMGVKNQADIKPMISQIINPHNVATIATMEHNKVSNYRFYDSVGAVRYHCGYIILSLIVRCKGFFC